ncbi:MAG: hypothetical protein R6V54_00520 [Desulfobacteraceae bacterium]
MSRNNTAGFLLICLLLLCFCGCSGLKKPHTKISRTEGHALVERIKAENRKISTCKGKGWLTLSSPGQATQKFRVAFAAALPDRIRMTLLSGGVPAETVAADGQTVTFVSHTGQHKRYTIRSDNPSLEKLVSIPVTARELIALFAGLIPLHNFDSAAVFQEQSPGKTVLVLNRQWKSTTQKLYLDEKKKVYRFDILDSGKEPLYSVRLSDFKQYSALKVHTTSLITDSHGRRLHLNLTDYQANIPLDDAIFTLPPTE